MSLDNIGNKLNKIALRTQFALFGQGELAQLSFNAFNNAGTIIKDSVDDEVTLSYPVGYKPDNTPLMSNHTYKKEDLINKYIYLADNQISINGVYQFVILIEAMFNDILRSVILKFPKKIAQKKSISIGSVLSLDKIEDIHLHAVDCVLNELSYKSPKDYAEELNKLLSINFLECPAYLKYMEIKATRDIHIHNQGTANDIYISKSGSHARVKANDYLPIKTQYFLESYEVCIQLTEWTELRLHDVWHSSNYEEQQKEKEEKKKINDGNNEEETTQNKWGQNTDF